MVSLLGSDDHYAFILRIIKCPICLNACRALKVTMTERGNEKNVSRVMVTR